MTRGARLVAFAMLQGIAANGVIGEESSFEKLGLRYARIKSVHLVATADVDRNPASGSVSGRMAIEFWANAHGYRARCTSDPALGYVEDMDLAFDGAQWQLLQLEKRELAITTDGSRPSPIACPNPLFLMVEYVGAVTPGCESCGVRISDLWDESVEIASLQRKRDTDEYFIAGRSSGDSPRSEFRLTVGRQAGEYVPISLVRFYPSGRPAVEFVATAFSPTVVGLLPTRIVGRAYEDRGGSRQIDEFRYSINVLELNKRLDERTFLIDWSLADTVFDLDAKQYVVHPNLDELNERLRSMTAEPIRPDSQ